MPAFLRRPVTRQAVVAAVLIAVGAFGIRQATSPSQPAPTTSRPAAQQPSTAAMRASVEAFLPEATHFVEQHRGLHFTRPVTVSALADAEFRKRLEALPGDSPEDLTKTTKELRALGLITGRVDVGAIQKALLGEAVAGFYDPPSHSLVVRGHTLSPWVREVIIHELTHALQDQIFNINRPQLDKSPDEQGLGYHTLLEGDALRVESAYHKQMSEEDQLSADDEGSAAPPAGTPPVLVDQLQFPYSAGPDFISAVLAKRGEAGVNEAFAAPPTTSSQLIHPERYLAGQGPVHVDPPPADGKVFDQGAVGEEVLRMVLEEAVSAHKLSAAAADVAAASWAGDWASSWDAGPRACLRAQFVTVANPRPLVDALHAFASSRSGVTVMGNGPVTVTSCG